MKGKAGKKRKFAVLGLCALFLIGVLPAGFSEGINNIQTVQAATKVKINKTKATLIKTQTLQLKITGTDSKVIWKSSKKSVASVDENGLVTAKKKGSATITATVDGKKYTCEINVETPSISVSQVILSKDQSMTLKVNGTTQKVKWSTSDKSIVGIRSNGFIKGKKSGTATITAQIGEFEYTCNVTVENPSFKNDYEYMIAGDKMKLTLDGTNQKVSWESFNPKIATVDNEGNVKAIADGWTKITAKVNGKEYLCEVNVYAFNQLTMCINETNIREEKFKIGDFKQITFHHQFSNKIMDINPQLVQWETSDESIATVSKDGILNIVGNGIVRITATYMNSYIESNIQILDEDYIQKNMDVKIDLNAIKTNPDDLYDYITLESKIKESFPIDVNGEILFYDNNHNVVATTNCTIKLNKSGAKIIHIRSIRGNVKGVTSYEFLYSKFYFDEYEPLIYITNDISITYAWTSKNIKEERFKNERFKNEYMLTIKNNSRYDMRKCVIKIKAYDVNGTVILENEREVMGTYDPISTTTEKEVSKIEFEVSYAYAEIQE